MPGGSVEHLNEEPGQVWMERVPRTYPARGLAQPGARAQWEHTQSVKLIQQIMGHRMFPLTLDGIDAAIGELLR